MADHFRHGAWAYRSGLCGERAVSVLAGVVPISGDMQRMARLYALDGAAGIRAGAW